MEKLSTFEYRTIKKVCGPLVFVGGIKDPVYGSLVEIELYDGTRRTGQIIDAGEDIVVIQVFEENIGMDLERTKVRLIEKELRLEVSPQILGRIFDGRAKPKDGLPELIPEKSIPISGSAINPYSRDVPVDFIETGFSAIDGLNTLVRGQKLPIFSLAGLPANKIISQLVKQAEVKGEERFAVVFAGMGIPFREASFFLESFQTSGKMENTVVFLNLAADPVIERLLTPRYALTCAEYLAFDLDFHVLVVLHDMTNYCEALRQISSSKEEIPGRRGYPGYMYTDLASLYERAGRIKKKPGSITQIPILTMPQDDITHPIVDLTGYITEGQIVLSRSLYQKGIYPPIDVLPSLSRLMNQGIGEGKTREDHRQLANQLYATYSHGIDLRKLRDIVGVEALSEMDKKYLKFCDEFEKEFIGQGESRRSIEETLMTGWRLLAEFPTSELRRISRKFLETYLEKLKDWWKWRE
ncbi:MAG: V-type ATP synthase subunit B [Candidatus Omnitrophica bacterium]|nr:V-type ATP synthase subunit B [Candidatus Omnitrophota bacterium]